ncbi:MAG: hypothetical protein KDC39_12645 [Actinobacteria bacterium]|nr:hypothetical protein [Actinomycetota bacterium]
MDANSRSVWSVLLMLVVATTTLLGVVSPAPAVSRGTGSGEGGSLQLGAAGYSPRGVPERGQALLGAATTGNIQDLENRVGGTLGLRRSYFRADQMDSAVRTAREDLQAGRLPWISFKLPHSWSAMAHGEGDGWAAQLAEKLGELPGPVWVALHHEPEGDGDPSEWVAMQQRLSPILRARPNIAFTIILMGWHQFFSGDPSLAMERFWPGSQHVDVLGFDPYNWFATTKKSGSANHAWDELARYYDAITSWLARSGNQDVAWGIAETGISDEAAIVPKNHVAPNGKRVAVDGPGSEWITRAYQDMREAGGVALSYFSVAPGVNGEPADWSWPITGGTKASDFARALAVSDRMGQAPQVTAPTTVKPLRVSMKRKRDRLIIRVRPQGVWEVVAKRKKGRPDRRTLTTNENGRTVARKLRAGRYVVAVRATDSGGSSVKLTK